MTDIDAKAANDALAAPLRRAQSIHAIRDATLAMLLAATAGLLAYRFAPIATYLVGRHVDAVFLGFFVFTPAIIAGLSLAFGNPPSLRALAHRADNLYKSGERLTTALEQEYVGTGPASAILAGLRRDAAAYAARINPSRLVHPFGARVIIAIVALAVAVALFSFAPTMSPPPSAPVAALKETADPVLRAENVERLAGILSEDADQRDNDFLKKVADAASQLAKRDDLSPEAYRDELAGLLDNARLAYGRMVPSWLLQKATKPEDRYGLTKDRNFSALTQRAQAANIPDPQAGSGEEMVPELLSERNLQNPPIPAPLPGQLTIAPVDNADLSMSTSNVGGRNASDSLTGQAKAGASGGQPPSLGNKGDAVDIDSASALLAGGASQSGQGASRTAGRGTQDLTDPDRTTSASLPPEQEEVLLPPGEYTKGKRIRVQVAPETASAETGTRSIEGGFTATRGLVTPIPVDRDLPSLRDQAVFSRFFTHEEDGGV